MGRTSPWRWKKTIRLGTRRWSIFGSGWREKPVPLPRIGGVVGYHVFMYFLLQINAHGPVRANDFIGTDACVGAHIAAGIRDANISRVVADGVVSAFDRCCDQSVEGNPGERGCIRSGSRLRRRQARDTHDQQRYQSSRKGSAFDRSIRNRISSFWQGMMDCRLERRGPQAPMLESIVCVDSAVFIR